MKNSLVAKNVISAAHIERVLTDTFPNLAYVYTVDRDYICPSRRWVMSAYRKWYLDLLWEWGFVAKDVNSVIWKTHFDCDNYSSLFRSLAGVRHGRRRKAEAQGVAIGSMGYLNAGEGPHAINCAFVGEQADLMFIEPQGVKEIILTEAELLSPVRILV